MIVVGYYSVVEVLIQNKNLNFNTLFNLLIFFNYF